MTINKIVTKMIQRIGIDISHIKKYVPSYPTVERIITKEKIRNRYINKQLQDFNPKFNTGQKSIYRFAVLWESNQRMRWLEISNDDPETQIIYLPRSIFNPVWRHLLSDYLKMLGHQKSQDEYALDYYSKKEFQKAREDYCDYCKAVTEYLIEKWEIDVFIMPKLNDDWTLDAIEGMGKAKANVVVDDREGSVSFKRMEVVPPKLKNILPLCFNRLFVHNKYHYKLFCDAGIDSAKMEINGQPATDYWFRPDTWLTRKQIHGSIKEDRFLILFFAFGARTYLNCYYGDEKRDWSPLCEDYHNVILQLLNKFGNQIQIVYKTGMKKGRDLYPGYSDFQDKINKYIDDGTLLELNTHYSSLDLVNQADLILGFQTTGMIEAMFTDHPIIYGAYGEFFNDIGDTLLPFHKSDALTWANNAENLFNVLKEAIEKGKKQKLNASEKKARENFRDKYMARSDGQVSKRLIEYARSLKK